LKNTTGDRWSAYLVIVVARQITNEGPIQLAVEHAIEAVGGDECLKTGWGEDLERFDR
jgi:hypothetical protein